MVARESSRNGGAHIRGRPPRVSVQDERRVIATAVGVADLRHAVVSTRDVATSHTWPHLLVGDVTAAETWRFVDTTIRSSYRAAGWELQRVSTDRGHECEGAFVAGCERAAIRVTLTKLRHAWTNGFVERVQGTILHEHWRIAIRRQYTSRVSVPCNGRSMTMYASITVSVRIAATGATA